jgi:hypothetical protein
MEDAGLIAILLAAFALAIGLVRALGRIVDSDGPDGWADEPPDTEAAGAGAPGPAVIAPDGPADPGRSR